MNFSLLYINGAWVEPLTADRIAVENPATKTVIAHVPACRKEDTDRAVAAAKAAAIRWQNTAPEARIAIATQALEYLLAQRDAVIDLEIAELGSSRKQTVGAHFTPSRTYSHLHSPGERIPLDHPTGSFYDAARTVRCCCRHHAVELSARASRPKTLAGVTDGQHRRTQTESAYAVDRVLPGRCLSSGGIAGRRAEPRHGRGSEVGDVLSAHPDVDMISFTGSTSGGITVARQALLTVKQIHLELGGKSPSLLLPDGDPAMAARMTLGSLLPNCGQTCSALSRLLVPIARKEEAEAAVLAELQHYTVGDPTDETTDIGCLASRQQYDKVRRYIELGLEEGATMLSGEVLPAEPQGGYFVRPVIFTDVTPQMTIAQEEIFGPVLSILTYTDIDEAVALANDTIYGLNAAVCGSHAQAVRIARRIRSGNVYINEAARDVTAPFGGYKQSGIGREGGLVGLLDFTQTKVLFDED